MVAYENAGREHLVVVPVFSPAELRPGAAVLDADWPLHVLALPGGGFAELHLPLVPAAHRLADAAGGVHHPVDGAAARARAGGRLLGGDGKDRVLHGAVRGGLGAARRAVAAHGSANPVSADPRRLRGERHLFAVSQSLGRGDRGAPAGAFSAYRGVGAVL